MIKKGVNRNPRVDLSEEEAHRRFQKLRVQIRDPTEESSTKDSNELERIGD